MKKRLLTVAAAAITVFGAMAEGYQINSLSARQIGMGHTGIAQKLGAESMFFNPAGLAYMDGTFDLSGSFTALSAHATATVGGKDYKTDNGIATPLGVHAAFSVFDNLKAGISLYTPYGSSINWTDNWPGSVLNQNVNLKVFTLQPTISWAITPEFSIGAGAMITWGTVDLNKALVNPATADLAINTLKATGQLPQETPLFGNTSPASVNLKGTADIAVGLNIGAMYTLNEKLTFGASLRTKMAMKVGAGNAYLRTASPFVDEMLLKLGADLSLLNEANFKAEMPCPMVLGLGVSYKPIPRLLLAFDARLTGWKTYKYLDIEFLADQLQGFNQHIEKKYKNSWCYSLGAQYSITDRLDLRAGLMVDTSPVNKEYYNPETPGMTKIEPTCGFSFRPVKNLSVDFGFMYIHGCGIKNASCTYDDLLGKVMIGRLTAAGIPLEQVQAMGFRAEQTFTADYKLHAFSPSIGISYNF